MVRIKKHAIIPLGVLLCIALFIGYTSRSSAHDAPGPGNPYITTATVLKIPTVPVAGTQNETGYELIIVDGFTSTESFYTLTNTYGQTAAAATKEVMLGTTTLTTIEHATFDEKAGVWTVYRTAGNEKTITFTTTDYRPMFDILNWYSRSPHYVTLRSGTPVVLLYGVTTVTISFEPVAIVYGHAITYTTTINGRACTIINIITGRYSLESAKFATEILAGS